MKQFVFIACLLLHGVAAKEKQLKLEDIERDNLANERKIKEGHGISYPPKPLTPPKMQYGFIPIKTPENYVHQHQQTAPPQHIRQQQQYQYIPQEYVQQQPQFVQHPQYTQAYIQPATLKQEPQRFTEDGGYQAESTPTAPQQHYQYVPQIQYVLDNHINHQQQEQATQYYPVPHYIYVQQYPASSNNLHSITDTKGQQVQYVMYVPESYLKQQEQQPEPEYVYETEPAPQPVQQQPPVRHHYKPSSVVEMKREPTSLLDSYVPSYLQYQYYKRQQENANAIKVQHSKLSPPQQPQHHGKGDTIKSYAVNYRLHHHQVPTYLPHHIKQ